MRDSRKRRIRFFRRFFKRKLKQWQWVWSDVRFNEKSLEEAKRKTLELQIRSGMPGMFL